MKKSLFTRLHSRKNNNIRKQRMKSKGYSQKRIKRIGDK